MQTIKSLDWATLEVSLKNLNDKTFDKEALDLCIECLSHKVWRARKLASEILTNNLPLVFPNLCKYLNVDNNHVRYWVMQILAKAGPNAIAHLIDAYESLEHEDKIFCLRAIAKIRSNLAIPFATRELNNDTWSIRQEAANILIELKQETVPALKELLKSGTDHQRYWAFKLIGNILQEKAIPTFKTILFSKEYEEKIRSYSLSGLKEIQNAEIIPILIDTLDSDLWSLRAQSSKLLMQTNKDCTIALIKSLTGKSKATRYWATQLLNEKAEEKYLAHFESCLKEKDPELRFSAISIVAKIHTKNAVLALIPLLTDEIWYLRKHTSDSILQMGNIAIEPLLARLKDFQEEELFWVCRILGKLGHSSALSGLATLLNHKSKDIRLQAIAAIAAIDSEGSIKLLVNAFNNEFWTVRAKASDALLTIGKKAVLILLRQAINNSESLGYWINKTIEDFGLPGALAIYEILLESSSKDANIILEELAQLKPEILYELYSKYELQRFHIAEKLTNKQSLNKASLVKMPSTGLNFHPILKSDFSHEQALRFQEILTEFRNLNGSILHLKINQPPIARVNGVLCKCTNHKLSSLDIQEFIAPFISAEEIKSFSLNGSCEIAIPYNEVEHYKLNLSNSILGVEAVIHKMHSSIPDFKTLNLPVEFLTSLARLSRGLVLVSGPVASGKSLTILSLLAHINRHFAKSIITLEDSIEYPLISEKSLISQRAFLVNFPSYESTFSTISKEDADIIYSARTPDFPLCETLLHLAASKTLVFLETNAASTRDAIEKLLSSFPNMHAHIYAKLLQRALVASIHLRLVNTVDEGKQIPATEYFLNNSVIQNSLHLDGLDDLQKIIRDANNESCLSLDDSLLQLATENKISYQEAMRFMEDKSRISISQIW